MGQQHFSINIKTRISEELTLYWFKITKKDYDPYFIHHHSRILTPTYFCLSFSSRVLFLMLPSPLYPSSAITYTAFRWIQVGIWGSIDYSQIVLSSIWKLFPGILSLNLIRPGSNRLWTCCRLSKHIITDEEHF